MWFTHSIYLIQNLTYISQIQCRYALYRGLQRPGVLRRGSAAVRLLVLRVRIPPWAWMSVSCECFVLAGIGLCDEPISRPEESYRLWCIIVCNLETSRTRRPWPALGCCARERERDRVTFINSFFFYWHLQPTVGFSLPLSWGFLDHTQWHTTVSRTPLDEGSAHRRDLYLTTHNNHNRQTSMPPTGFEPAIPAGERP